MLYMFQDKEKDGNEGGCDVKTTFKFRRYIVIFDIALTPWMQYST